jgi:phosphatidylinositol glycan class V
MADDGLMNAILVGSLVTNLCHLLSAMVIRQLVLRLTPPTSHNGILASATAAIYVVSPAGVFLSAPYAEAPFALLSFSGQYLYACAALDRASHGRTVKSEVMNVMSGLVLAAATTLRTNGLLNGALFAYDALVWAIRLSSAIGIVPLRLRFLEFEKSYQLPSIWSTVVAGVAVAMGFIFPQYRAYQEFCRGDMSGSQPPWCAARVPSIYASIQARYWGVGLFRYWTLSNLPLFLIAGPMLWVLFTTGLGPFSRASAPPQQAKDEAARHMERTQEAVWRRLAVPQLLIALLTLTTAHVQIVNRISSGYPVWYMFVAQGLLTWPDAKSGTQFGVRAVMMYAIIQAVLFSAFLPPA